MLGEIDIDLVSSDLLRDDCIMVLSSLYLESLYVDRFSQQELQVEKGYANKAITSGRR